MSEGAHADDSRGCKTDVFKPPSTALRRLNVVIMAAHFVSSGAILGVSLGREDKAEPEVSFSWPNWIATADGLSKFPFTEGGPAYTVSLGGLAAAFSFVSGLGHLYIGTAGHTPISQGFSVVRWSDYALSYPFMQMLLYLMAGGEDLFVILGIIGSNAVMMITTLCTELLQRLLERLAYEKTLRCAGTSPTEPETEDESESEEKRLIPVGKSRKSPAEIDAILSEMREDGDGWVYYTELTIRISWVFMTAIYALMWTPILYGFETMPILIQGSIMYTFFIYLVFPLMAYTEIIASVAMKRRVAWFIRLFMAGKHSEEEVYDTGYTIASAVSKISLHWVLFTAVIETETVNGKLVIADPAPQRSDIMWAIPFIIGPLTLALTWLTYRLSPTGTPGKATATSSRGFFLSDAFF